MVTDDHHPAMMRAARQLGVLLRDLFIDQEITGALIRVGYQVLREHRLQCYRSGVAFPKLTLFVMPLHGVVDAVRADLNRDGIINQMTAVKRRHPHASPLDIAMAAATAWPRADITELLVEPSRRPAKRAVNTGTYH